MPPESKMPLVSIEKANALNQKTEEHNGAVHIEDLSNSYETLWGTFEMPLKFTNVFFISLVHLWALYTFLTFDYIGNWRTALWAIWIGFVGGFGVTGGAHRFFTHRCYKAKVPLRIILMLCYCVAGQNSLLDWVRDHRVHHKFSETDADPHNSNRGFFFAHVGWLMMKKHPEVLRKGKHVDINDLYEDSVFRFHLKYFIYLKAIFCFIIPTMVPVYCWGSSLFESFVALSVARYVTTLNITWSVNSAAHLWGMKPYDKKINPAENLAVSLLSMGEGWHNYHHTFPWDYKAAELGQYSKNLTTMFIDFFAKIGWAYDLKQPSKELVKSIVINHGDGSHHQWGTEIPESPKLE